MSDGFMCRAAMRAREFWDFVDKRQIDAHFVTIITLLATIKITDWAMDFARHGDRPGIEVAAIIAAVVAPWSALQAAVIKFVFETRTKSFTNETRP